MKLLSRAFLTSPVKHYYKLGTYRITYVIYELDKNKDEVNFVMVDLINYTANYIVSQQIH